MTRILNQDMFQTALLARLSVLLIVLGVYNCLAENDTKGINLFAFSTSKQCFTQKSILGTDCLFNSSTSLLNHTGAGFLYLYRKGVILQLQD